MTKKPESTMLLVRPLDIQVLKIKIVGTAPYVQSRFSEKAKTMMRDKMEAGSTAKKGKNREARDFNADYLASHYVSKEGWHGIPANAFRAGMIRACSLVGFAMTQARMSVFILEDGYDKDGITPLVRINGVPEKFEQTLRNDRGGADIRVRTIFREWSVMLRVRYDGGQFTANDIANLLNRTGIQVGVGEGRPSSRESGGCGWGTFELPGGID